MQAIATLQDQRWRLLLATAIGSFMSPFDYSVVAVALPRMGASLHLGFVGAIGVQTIYLIALTAALIPAGRLADAAGKLTVFRWGCVAFAASSLAAALSQNLLWLLLARTAEGLSIAMVSANAPALVATAFPSEERGRALGLNVTAVYVALAVGPIVGGVLTDALSWRAIFLVNIFVAAITLVSARGLGRLWQRTPPRLDVPGAVLVALAVSSSLAGLTFAPRWGWLTVPTLSCLAAGVLAIAAFVWVELRVDNPLLDLTLLKNRSFATGIVSTLGGYAAFFAIPLLTSVLLEVVDGISPQTTGFILLLQPIFMVGLSPAAGRLSDRLGSRLLTTGGLLAVGAGMVLLAAATAGSLVAVEAGLAVTGIGFAAFSSPNSSAVLGSVGRPQLGLASGTMGTMRVLGQSLSVAVLGTLAASSLGATGEAVIFSASRGTLVTQSYVAGFHLAMLVGAAMAVFGAVFSVMRPGQTRPGGEVTGAG